jgi:hypothetical protein
LRNHEPREQRSAVVKREAAKTLRAFLIELPIYAALVLAYFFLVLHLLGHWLNGLVHQHRALYAVVALALMIGQALVLEWVSSLLLRLLRRTQ